MAPFSWRVSKIMDRFNIEKGDAEKKVKETDKRRENFMEFFRGNKPDNELFHLILNRSTLTSEEIVDQIIHLAKMRNLI
jgi:cytidylate kinase